MLRKRILILAKPSYGFSVWHGRSQRPEYVLNWCLDITSLVTEAKEGESGKRAGPVPRRMEKSRLRMQDIYLGMCLFLLYSVRFPEMWVLDITSLGGHGAADPWDRNGIWHPVSLETKEHCASASTSNSARSTVSAQSTAVGCVAAEPGQRPGEREGSS